MSGILGIVSSGGALPDRERVEWMAGRMTGRGTERIGEWRDAHASLAVARFEWELRPAHGGDVLVLSEDGLTVAADATLYYRGDLLRKLAARGVSPGGTSASHLILAAYRAWGLDCPKHLEGDFAFLIWDSATRTALCARDFAGRRPLFYAALGDALVVASAPSSVLAHPDCNPELNLPVLAALAGGMFAVPGGSTCFRAISELPSGHRLVSCAGSPRLDRFWSPPEVRESGQPAAAAAEELRVLLADAVRERMVPGEAVSVWLSGGWDSTAIFALGSRCARTDSAYAPPRAVSISYPPGDPGREDERIQKVAEFWDAPVHWLDILDIPFFERAEGRAACREEPFAHPFEMWNRALAQGSRAVGTRVALDGVGGDQWFGVSDLYLADLFRQGRWAELAREWQAKGLGGSGIRTFLSMAVRPAMPRWLLTAASAVRPGLRPQGPFDRLDAEWIDPALLKHGDLLSNDDSNPAHHYRTLADQEFFLYLTDQAGIRLLRTCSELALDEGVETRSPLYDERVIRFAATRPRQERSAGAETKILLRRALQGLLPQQILAPRPFRTGTTGRYARRAMRYTHAALFSSAFRNPVLAELGIVNAGKLQRRWDEFVQQGWSPFEMSLLLTFQAELWIRSRTGHRSIVPPTGRLAAAPLAGAAG